MEAATCASADTIRRRHVPNDLKFGIFVGCGNAKRWQGEGNTGAGVYHRWNSQLEGSCEYHVTVFSQRIDPMSYSVKFDCNKLQFLHATFHFSLIFIPTGVGAETGQAKKAT